MPPTVLIQRYAARGLNTPRASEYVLIRVSEVVGRSDIRLLAKMDMVK
jgi:hypothetical protein